MKFLTATSASIAAHQRRRRTVVIRVPEHWATADQADLERWLVGAVITAAGLPENAVLDICGVRNGLVYHSPRAGYTDVRKSRLIRKPGAFVTVCYAVVER